MNTRAKKTLLALGGMGIFLVGCAAEDHVTRQVEGLAVLSCNDKEFPNHEEYDLEVLNRELADDPTVSEMTGLASIASCEDARALRAAQDSLLVDRDDVPSAVPTAGEIPEDLEEKIWRGVSTTRPYHGKVSVTGVGGCSGVFINPNTMLTSAHCIPNTTAAKSLSGDVATCTATHTESKNTRTNASCRVWRHESYSGTSDAGDDIGMVSFSDTIADKGAYIYTGDLNQYEWLDVAGYGVTGDGANDGGTLREDPDFDGIPVDARMTHQINSYAEQGVARTCNGDSGMPLIKRLHNRDMVVALDSSSVKENDCDPKKGGCCTKYKGKQMHTRLRSKIDWIEERSRGCWLSSTGDYYSCL